VDSRAGLDNMEDRKFLTLPGLEPFVSMSLILIIKYIDLEGNTSVFSSEIPKVLQPRVASRNLVVICKRF
jgi:hypothetical protein